MADKPLVHDRNLAAFRDRWGIKASEWPDAARLEENIRAQVQVDDASLLTLPPRQNIAIYQCSQAAVAVSYSGCDITIYAPGGAYLDYYISAGGGALTTQSLVAIATEALLSPAVCYYQSLSRMTSRVKAITSLAFPANAATATAFAARGGPIYLGNGQRLQMFHPTVNTAFQATVFIRECA